MLLTVTPLRRKKYCASLENLHNLMVQLYHLVPQSSYHRSPVAISAPSTHALAPASSLVNKQRATADAQRQSQLQAAKIGHIRMGHHKIQSTIFFFEEPGGVSPLLY